MSDFSLTLFCIGILWLAYVYAGYPLLLAILGRIKGVSPHVDDRYRPSVSVLIAARNEEKDIAWKIQETLAWHYPPELLRILVASDASDDHTDAVVRGIADPRVTLIRMENRGGKNRALNALAQHAHGDLLFFTDANSHIEPGCLLRMVRHLADTRVGCVTGNSYSSDQDYNPAQENGSTVYWGYELLVKLLENRLGSVLVCDGAIFCIRKSLYTPVSPDLANDLELPLRIGHAGYWTLYEPHAHVLEQETSSPSEEFARRRRICGQGALGMWRLRKTLDGTRAFQFVSQKLLRWLTLLPLLMLFVASACQMPNRFFTVLFALQMLFYVTALIGSARMARGAAAGRVFSIPSYISISAVGAFLGVVDAWVLGRRYDIWESPSLSRGRTISGLQNISS